MSYVCDAENCTGCSACAAACQQKCIVMQADEEGFLRPVIDKARCMDCGLCGRACPVLNPCPLRKEELRAYAVLHREDAIRQASTSGGAFTLLSEAVLSKGGVVFGATYQPDFSVAHCRIERAEELGRLRTAKYTQSDIKDSYKEAKAALRAGQTVLFSGTPCQIEGLQTYLKKDYERLLTADVICHGVPSPEVWKVYLKYRQDKDAPDARILSVNMRDKCTGWATYSMGIGYDNGTHYIRKGLEDAYIRAFIGNLDLRPSCYQCRFKGANRCSDFTLGDYWGVWSQRPEIDDHKGVSIVLIHTAKGAQLFEAVSGNASVYGLDSTDCLAENPSATQSSVCTEKRETFMKNYRYVDFEALVDGLLPRKTEKRKRPVCGLLRKASEKFCHFTSKK